MTLLVAFLPVLKPIIWSNGASIWMGCMVWVVKVDKRVYCCLCAMRLCPQFAVLKLPFDFRYSFRFGSVRFGFLWGFCDCLCLALLKNIYAPLLKAMRHPHTHTHTRTDTHVAYCCLQGYSI